MNLLNVFQSWGKVLVGKVPMLSIEITRECPLHCPGCYAYGDTHLGQDAPNLRSVSDYRGDDLVKGILRLVDEHEPLQVSLVGGEPLVRHRELSKVLPELSRRGIHTMVVTSAVIPIPEEWSAIPQLTIAVSVDGNPEDHDIRRKPATYERILKNIQGSKINVHWTVVRSNVEREGYMDRYLDYWTSRPEVNYVWVSIYTPQKNEDSPERLTATNREQLAAYFDSIAGKYKNVTMHKGMIDAFLHPPESPSTCLLSKLSVNYTADLKSRVEPCVFGGEPNCAECGCSMSLGMHWMGEYKVAGPVRGKHLLNSSLAIGRTYNRLTRHDRAGLRWADQPRSGDESELVQIGQ